VKVTARPLLAENLLPRNTLHQGDEPQLPARPCQHLLGLTCNHLQPQQPGQPTVFLLRKWERWSQFQCQPQFVFQISWSLFFYTLGRSCNRPFTSSSSDSIQAPLGCLGRAPDEFTNDWTLTSGWKASQRDVRTPPSPPEHDRKWCKCGS